MHSTPTLWCCSEREPSSIGCSILSYNTVPILVQYCCSCSCAHRARVIELVWYFKSGAARVLDYEYRTKGLCTRPNARADVALCLIMISVLLPAICSSAPCTNCTCHSAALQRVGDPSLARAVSASKAPKKKCCHIYTNSTCAQRLVQLTPLELVLLRTIFLNRPVSNCWPCPGVDMTKPKTWHKLAHAFPRLGRTFIPLLK